MNGRLSLLDDIQRQQRALSESVTEFAASRQQAVSVLTDPKVFNAFNVENEDSKIVRRYGANKFGFSLLMAKRLIESSVNLVQVNLGKNSSWDTHQRNFASLKDHLLPPLDLCVSALLDDMASTGLLDETLVIAGGEFGRTPKINKRAGRDHWGPVNTILFAGGGVRGGNVIGASDRIGAEPISDIQTPENLAATIYDALGIPRNATWPDFGGRPQNIYHAKPINRLFS